MSKISVVLATHNEAENITTCLMSVKGLADEIIIVDGSSTDNTVELAKAQGAKVHITTNPENFHVNKQKAINYATHPWILQLDADERVSKQLADEIRQVTKLTDEDLVSYEDKVLQNKLFKQHTDLISQRDGKVGIEEDKYSAFFIPRLNNFLGRNLRHGGVYPDGVIRLIKNGKAHLPAKDVHEQMVVEGKVGWLMHDLLHNDSPTFDKYFKRWNRYTRLLGKEIKTEKGTVIKFFKYLLIMPIYWFLLTYIRHKGFLDSWQGFVFFFFSSLRFPVGYIKSLS